MNTQAQSTDSLDPRFETKPAITLVGIQRRYQCDDKSGIPSQWDDFVPRIEQITDRVSEVAYGVCANSTETHFDYFCGIEVPAGSSSAQGLETLILAPQRYAIFAHRGRVEVIVHTVHQIFSRWLPSSRFSVAPGVDLVEWYSADFDPATHQGSVEIWIPIRE